METVSHRIKKYNCKNKQVSDRVTKCKFPEDVSRRLQNNGSEGFVPIHVIAGIAYKHSSFLAMRDYTVLAAMRAGKR